MSDFNISSSEEEDNNNDKTTDEQIAADMQLALDLAAMQEAIDHGLMDDQNEATTATPNDVLEAMIEHHASTAPDELLNSGLIGGRVIGHSSPDREPPASSLAVAASPKNKKKVSPFVNLFGPGKPKHSLAEAFEDGTKTAEEIGTLLYVPCEINGRVVEMMVDSGSQTSVISSTMMHTLNLEKRLNKRYCGVVSGIGKTKIIGKLEKLPCKIGHVEFRLYFLVIELPQDMMILGMDQMRRFKCLIDLENDVLVFGGRGGVEVPFLPPDPKQKRPKVPGCTIS